MKMERLLVASLAVVLLLAVAAVPVALAGDEATQQDRPEEVAPGDRLMGVVAAQDAELATEIDERAFGQTIAAAAADGETGDLVQLLGDRLETLQGDQADLEDRLESLQAQREAGEITHGQYVAELARVEVQRQHLERSASTAANASHGLPTEGLLGDNVNVTAIEELRTNASELGGQEVRDIAHNIAGADVGAPAANRPSVEDRMVRQVSEANSTDRALDRAEHWVTHSERTLQRAQARADRQGPVDEDVNDTLAAAENALDVAQDALDAAMDTDDEEEAVGLAEEAASYAAEATDLAREALDGLRGPPAGVPPETPPGQA